MEDLDWYVGFDWASAKHRACLLDGSGRVVDGRDVGHDGTSLAEFFEWLLSKTGSTPERIGVAIETTHGPIVEGCLGRGFQVYSINPKQLDRFRDRFAVSGAKDDKRDAHALGSALRTDPNAFRHLSVEDPLIIELREWSRLRDDLIEERTRLTNRMREQLWRYYPQMLKLGEGDLDASWVLALWQVCPTPDKAKKLRKPAIQRILDKYHVRRLDTEQVLQIMREEPFAVAAGTVEAATAHIASLIKRVTLVKTQITAAERALAQLTSKLEAMSETEPGENEPGQFSEQCDITILRSCPGLGKIGLATLLAEADEPLRNRNYQVLRALSGTAPVTRQSGKSKLVMRRLACNKRLRNALHYWAYEASRLDADCRERYAAMRRRGLGHARALRSLGDRLLKITCTMLNERTLYDPDYNAKRNPG